MLRFIPTYSILLFAILFIAASILYPGGSDFDLQAKGFSWLHNYWCNLTATIAKNGMPNPAQPVALTAQFVLCIGLLFFWYQLPRLFSEKPIYKSIRYFGCSAILVGSLSFTSLHEWAINLGGLLGGVAIAITFIGLFKHQYRKIFYIGLFNLFWLGIDYFFYEMKTGIYYLPILQKIAVLFFLFWVMIVNFESKNTTPKTT